MATRRLGATLLALMVAAGTASAVDVPLTGIDGTPDPGSGGETNLPGLGHGTDRPSAKATLRGGVFYNDRREHGRFAERYDKDRNPGRRCWSGERDDDQPCSANWLGGRYIVVDVIERDEGFLPTDTNCKREDVLTSVTVGRDGAFKATIDVTDPCRNDKRSSVAVELRMRLRFCGADFCFSVKDRKNQLYTLSGNNASASNPLIVRPGDDLTVPDMHFNTTSDPERPDDNAIAANYYASIVDAIVWLHRDNGIPFYKQDFGELQFIYPSDKTRSGTTRGADEVVMASKAAWVNGELPVHEYGHVLMLRAWGGDYGFEAIGDTEKNNERVSSLQNGFKESWAAFVTRAVFDETYGCAGARFDDSPPVSEPGDGAWWRLNMSKALCDWYDSRDDGLDGFADPDTYSMWYNLRRMYLDRALYGGRYEDPGLWFCDYVKYYLDVRKSPRVVGQETYDHFEAKIAGVLYNNNIACWLPRPT